MTHSPVSRRAFFGRMSSGCGFGIALKETVQPEKAWIVVALGWEYNDEFAYHEGEYPQPHVPLGELNKSPYNGPAYFGRHLTHFARIAGPGVPLSHGPNDGRAIAYSFGSSHDGVIHFAMADGSGRSISTSISSRVAGQLANRLDGEGPGEF